MTLQRAAKAMALSQPPAKFTVPGRELLPLDRAKARVAAADMNRDGHLRKRVGELVGSVFYTHLIKEMQKTTFETPLMHGGRGEEVFKEQMNAEIGKRIGTTVNNPATERLYKAMKRIAHAMPATKPALEAVA